MEARAYARPFAAVRGPRPVDIGISTGHCSEGRAKRAIRGVNRSCCGGERMKDGGLEWMNYFPILTQLIYSKSPFNMYFGF